MDHMIPREKDFEVDLESGVTSSEQDSSKVPVSGAIKQAKTLLGKICSGFVDGSIKSEDTASLSGNVSNSNGVSPENVKAVNNKILEGEEPVDYVERTPVREKRKKTSNKKPPKPPRPPRGPSLDAADQKLIKEISEFATLKRARIERMKALKKLKATKSQSSSSSSIFAMVLTILFCVVIIFQGMSSRSSSPVNFQGSPISESVTEGGLISVQYYAFPSASEPNGPGSGSPNFVEQIAGSDTSEKLTRVAG
ncbi:transmembrane [Fagus crenata]